MIPWTVLSSARTEPSRFWIGLFGAIIGFIAPIENLIICCLCFIAIDFIVGCWASYKRAKRKSEKWYFQSVKAWSTIYKVAFVLIGLVLVYVLDSEIITFADLKLANIYTGFVCGTELWSYLENAAEISNHRIFRGLKKIVKKKLDEAGVPIEGE